LHVLHVTQTQLEFAAKNLQL